MLLDVGYAFGFLLRCGDVSAPWLVFLVRFIVTFGMFIDLGFLKGYIANILCVVDLPVLVIVCMSLSFQKFCYVLIVEKKHKKTNRAKVFLIL